MDGKETWVNTMMLLAPWWLVEALTKVSMAVLCKIRFFETSFLLYSEVEVGFRVCQSFFPFWLIVASTLLFQHLSCVQGYEPLQILNQ